MPTSFLIDRIRRFYDRYPILVQMVVWLAFIMLPDPFITTQRLFSPEGVIAYGIRFFTSLLGILLFYLNFYVITPYLLRRNRLIWLLLVTPFLVILVLLSTNILYQSIAQGDLSTLTARMLKFQQSIFQQQKILSLPFPVVITTGLVVVVMISTSTGFAIYRDRNEVQTRHQQMEIEKKQAELNALKLQISPHFLFNTLNNMRWLARQKSDQTEDAILRLSDILRYMIYQVNEGPVPLSKEIDYLTDYVALQKLRLGDHNRVTFETDVDNDRVRVEPLLLIHFVENAFKHGMHHDEPSTVNIRLHVRDGLLTFETRNRLFYEVPEQPSPDSGVGVQNVERRLALHYPNRHLLRMQHKNGYFCVDLRIDLS
jgi:sensor histidine kinase YesM